MRKTALLAVIPALAFVLAAPASAAGPVDDGYQISAQRKAAKGAVKRVKVRATRTDCGPAGCGAISGYVTKRDKGNR